MGLTDRELSVLRLRAEGLTQAETAKRLKISQAAVSDFENNAKRKIKDAEDTIDLAKKERLMEVVRR